jgi:hypothetical protein
MEQFDQVLRSDSDPNELQESLIAGGKLKAAGTLHWNNPNQAQPTKRALQEFRAVSGIRAAILFKKAILAGGGPPMNTKPSAVHGGGVLRQVQPELPGIIS